MKLNAHFPRLYGLAAMVGMAISAQAQPAPRIGFVYPAGGQISTSFEVTIGGQYLDEESQVIVSGEGITAKVLEHDKIPAAQVVDDYRDLLR